VLVLVVCLCPSSVHVVDTFSGTVLFPLLCSVLLKAEILYLQVYNNNNIFQWKLKTEILAYTYLLTPWNTVLLENLTGSQLVEKFPAFYGIRRFITVVTNTRHLSLSWASSNQSIALHSTSWRFILILSSQLSLGLRSGLFPSFFRTKILYTPLFSPILATCPAHHILLDLITQAILGAECRSLSSSLCSFLRSPLTFSLYWRIFCLKLFENPN
jgi:hypothetical protein